MRSLLRATADWSASTTRTPSIGASCCDAGDDDRRPTSSEAAAASVKKPFFLYVPLNAPHTPIVPTKEFQGTSGLNPYADFVRQVDADVGRLLAKLDAVAGRVLKAPA